MNRVIIIICLFFTQCNTHRNGWVYYNMPELKRIAQLMNVDPIPPAVITFPRAYVREISDSIFSTDFYTLKNMYDIFYKKTYSHFYDFLFDALNQRIKIDFKNINTASRMPESVNLDSKISSIFESKGINGLIKEYCYPEEKSHFYKIKIADLTANEIASLSYFFFINQYFRYDNDVKQSVCFKKVGLLIF